MADLVVYRVSRSLSFERDWSIRNSQHEMSGNIKKCSRAYKGFVGEPGMHFGPNSD